MHAYVVVQVGIQDPVTYQRYIALAPASIGLYGGCYLTRGGVVEVLEGEWDPRRFVILRFPSMEKARAWHDSPEYAPARELRVASATTLMLAAEGLAEPWFPAPPAV